MCKIPVALWIANAAACLSGHHGAVTRQAQLHQVSRQTVYNDAHRVQEAIRVEHSEAPSRERLLRENQELRHENDRLWEWLYQTIEFPRHKQREFGILAIAMGLSVRQIADLLALILGTKAAPGRSTIERWGLAAEAAAGTVLKRLDERCKGLVTTACLDEIFFHGRPVFVGVEPQSMTLILADKGDRLDRAAWLKKLVGWDALRYVVSDAGTVLQSALAWLAARRQVAGAALRMSLDVFHTMKEARRVLKIHWNKVKKDWKAAEKADLRVARFQRQGQYAYGPAGKARSAWIRVAKSMDQYDAAKAGWQKAKAALEVFGPDGRLNDRAWAEARVSEALPALAGKAWTTLRHLLQSPKAFAFLDRLHAELGRLPIDQELREALVRLWWLRRRARKDDDGHHAKAILLQEVLCWKLAPDWQSWYPKVAGTLGTTVRASSAVESVNSVLRMHQSRHRNLGQGLLDLKRLYWNTRSIVGKGRRRGRCPYQLLGLDLPRYDFLALVRAEMAEAVTPGDLKSEPQPSPG
jgi:tetratricopeptide (TPR) repeat protein